ncbi:hypothetical protein ILUMI_16594, partial [Ignelater luminosus]
MLKYLGKKETADRTPNLLTMRSTLKVELEKRSTDDDSSLASKKRNIIENDRTIAIQDSFWNCFEEIATDAGNVQNEVMETSGIANEIDFYLKIVRLDRTADPYKWWLANAKHATSKKRTWAYSDGLKFLKPYLEDQQTLTNVPKDVEDGIQSDSPPGSGACSSRGQGMKFMLDDE